jgi:hypothetical protein
MTPGEPRATHDISLRDSQHREPESNAGRKLKAKPSSNHVEVPFSGSLVGKQGSGWAGLQLGEHWVVMRKRDSSTNAESEMRNREPGPKRTPASRTHSTGARRHRPLLELLPLLILWGIVPGVHGYCSSSATCPLHASDNPAYCTIHSAASFWNFAGDRRSFPGLGLYTLAKISKDVSNCCYDIEVQAFMCEYKRGGTPVSCQARPSCAIIHQLPRAPVLRPFTTLRFVSNVMRRWMASARPAK